MRGFRVAVIDCDYPQYSVLRQRQRDTASAEASALVRQRLEAQFGRLDRQPYPVLAARPQTALREWEQYAARGQESCQAVLFDLPGTMGTEGVLSTLAALDYLVVPLKADRMVLESSLNFAATLNDRLITTGASRLRGIFLFWNLVDRRERNRLYDIYATGISQLGLRLLPALPAASTVWITMVVTSSSELVLYQTLSLSSFWIALTLVAEMVLPSALITKTSHLSATLIGVPARVMVPLTTASFW